MTTTLLHLIETAVENELNSLFESVRGFSLEKFKQLPNAEQMREYAGQFLTRMGKGSSRIVFNWKAGKVIKIAVRSASNKQNQKEVEQYFNNAELQPYFAKIYDFDDVNYFWIVSEGVQVIDDNAQLAAKFFRSEYILHGIVVGAFSNESFEESLKRGIKEHNESYRQKSDIYVEKEPVSMEKLGPLDLELFQKLYELTKLKVIDVDRYDHWGVTTTGRIVVVDYGLSAGGG